MQMSSRVSISNRRERNPRNLKRTQGATSGCIRFTTKGSHTDALGIFWGGWGGWGGWGDLGERGGDGRQGGGWGGGGTESLKRIDEASEGVAIHPSCHTHGISPHTRAAPHGQLVGGTTRAAPQRAAPQGRHLKISS